MLNKYVSFLFVLAACATGSLFAVPAWDYRVESLEIPKGSYFDTGFTPGTHPHAWVRFTTVLDSVPFGTQTKADGAFMLIHSSDKKLYYRYGRASSETATGAYEAGQVLSVACYEQLLVNGSRKSGGKTGLSFTTTETITVPGRAASTVSTIVHGFRFWDDTTLKCDLIPCVKDGTACFYDAVSETFLAVLGGGTVSAGARVDDDGRKLYDAADTLTIDVASSTTDLADWMAANEVEEIAGDKLIVKTGAGTLKVSTSALSGFTGDVHIDAGRVSTSVANPLGPASSGRVYVKAGATLETTWAVAGTPVSFGSKPVYIAGTGTDGAGAIYVKPLSINMASGHPSVVYLTADAKGGSSGHSRFGGNIYLEGHTFTVDYVGSWAYLQQGYSDTTGWGHVAIGREILWEGNKCNPTFNFGTAANTVFIRKGAGYRTNTYVQNSAYPWRLVMEADAYFVCGSGTSSWYGEVELAAGRHKLVHQGEWAWQKYYGKVTGPGGIGASDNWQTECIGLYSPSNDFTGGVYLKRNILALGCDGALPAAGAALTNYNGRVLLAAQTAPYDLPEAYFCQTGAVSCATAGGVTRGAWRTRLTKDGSGMLLYDSLVGSSNLVVKGGSVKFPVTAADAELPVFTNVQVRAGASVTFGDGYAGTWSVPCLVSGGGTIAGAVAAGGFAVDAAVAGETLAVAGALSFAADAKVAVPDGLPHAGVTAHTLVTATALTGLPRSTNRAWHVRRLEKGDGTAALQIVYGTGTQVILR